MRLGVSVPNRHVDADVVVPYALGVARAAGAGGAAFVMVGDKRADPQPVAQGGPLLGRLLPEVAGVPEVGALFLAPLWDRDHLADTVATLAALAADAGADLVPVLALGRTWGPGVDAAAAVRRLVDSIGAVRALADAPGALGSVRHVWLAGERPAAVRRAAELADGWLANAHHPLAALEDQVAALAAAGPPDGFRVAVRRDVVCRASAAEAEDEAARLLAQGYRGFGPGTLVAGDPAGCAAALARLAALGVDTVVVRPAAPRPQDGIDTIHRLLAEVPTHLERACTATSSS